MIIIYLFIYLFIIIIIITIMLSIVCFKQAQNVVWKGFFRKLIGTNILCQI